MSERVPKKQTIRQILEQPERDIMPLCDMRCCSIFGCSLMPENAIDFECFYIKDCYGYRVELLD